jgi:hypothetical protein
MLPKNRICRFLNIGTGSDGTGKNPEYGIRQICLSNFTPGANDADGAHECGRRDRDIDRHALLLSDLGGIGIPLPYEHGNAVL